MRSISNFNSYPSWPTFGINYDNDTQATRTSYISNWLLIKAVALLSLPWWILVANQLWNLKQRRPKIGLAVITIIALLIIKHNLFIRLINTFGGEYDVTWEILF